MYELVLILCLLAASSPLAMMLASACCEGPCPCVPGTSFQIDIAGTANNICTGCAAFDGTYFLTGPGTLQCAGTTSACVYKYSNTTMTDACAVGCNGVCIELVQDSAGNTCTVRIQGRDFVLGTGCTFLGGTPPFGRWVKSFGAGAADCSVYSALDIPFSTTNTKCDFSGATCTVTAI